MTVVYDRERVAALIKAARQITDELKDETEKIKIEMTRVLSGDEDDDALLDGPEAEKFADDADFAGVTPPKSFWRFWR
jgi:hypothetical protein